MSRSQGSADAEDGPQGRPADEDLRRVWVAVHLAQEMGARLGSGEVLFGPVPGEGCESGLIGVAPRRLTRPLRLGDLQPARLPLRMGTPGED
jgi:hypothetical protein